MGFINSPNEIIRDWYKGRTMRRDLFGRLKITALNPQFTYQNEYNKGDLQWVEKITGTATATHDPTDATVNLVVSAASDSIVRQTRRYLRYYSGKTSSTTMTFYTGPMADNTVFQAGQFDDDNGVFFERDATTEYIVLRSSGVEQKIARANWNLDHMRGFDFDKSVILQINLQWLGVGVAQVVFETPEGALIAAHRFKGSGFVESTYMRTANLPIRYQFGATAEFTGDPATAKQICAANGFEDGGSGVISNYRHTANTGISPVSATTTKRAIIAIRPKATFNSLTNRSQIVPVSIDIMTGSADIQWDLVYNPTLTGSPTWASADDESTVEYSDDVNTYTGGVVIQSGFIASGSGNTRVAQSANVSANYPLALDVDGLNPTTLVLVARSLSGTATVSAAIGFEEVY